MSCWHDVPDVEGQPTLTEIFEIEEKAMGRPLTDDEKHTIMHGVLAGRSAPEVIFPSGATFEEQMGAQQLQMQLSEKRAAAAREAKLAKRRKPTVLLDNLEEKELKRVAKVKEQRVTYIPASDWVIEGTYQDGDAVGFKIRTTDNREFKVRIDALEIAQSNQERLMQLIGQKLAMQRSTVNYGYEIKFNTAPDQKVPQNSVYDQMLEAKAYNDMQREERMRMLRSKEERMKEQMARSMDPVGYKSKK